MTTTETAFHLSHMETLGAIRENSPPIESNQRWVVRDKDGTILRKLRILAAHPDGGWIYIDEPSKLIRRDFEMLVTPEYNLRRIFKLEA